MRNEYTEAQEYEYREAMRERKAELDRQRQEDAMDCFDTGENDEH
jgi:hypothetical protein